jgi:hypothetical protein
MLGLNSNFELLGRTWILICFSYDYLNSRYRQCRSSLKGPRAVNVYSVYLGFVVTIYHDMYATLITSSLRKAMESMLQFSK